MRTLVRVVLTWLAELCDRVADWFSPGPPEPWPPTYDPLDRIPGEPAAPHLALVRNDKEESMGATKRKGPKCAKRPKKGKSRSAKSGKYVSRKFAERNKATTVTETE